ncbi:MAG TPA: hypothetical protein VFO21_13395 [Vicinamibacterales bacterium]|nr:hypothetical protein [Vicinamibacterales bacterium]
MREGRIRTLEDVNAAVVEGASARVRFDVAPPSGARLARDLVTA